MTFHSYLDERTIEALRMSLSYLSSKKRKVFVSECELQYLHAIEGFFVSECMLCHLHAVEEEQQLLRQRIYMPFKLTSPQL